MQIFRLVCLPELIHVIQVNISAESDESVLKNCRSVLNSTWVYFRETNQV